MLEYSSFLSGGDHDLLLFRQLHPYILPLVQGYFQVASFSIPQDSGLPEPKDTTHVDYIIMSRRSRERAGLRYQRRGIDDVAHVANFVETETITRVDVCTTATFIGFGLPIFSERTSPMFLVTFRLGGLVRSMSLPFRQYIHRP